LDCVEKTNEELSVIRSEQAKNLFELERTNIELYKQNEEYRIQVEALSKNLSGLEEQNG